MNVFICILQLSMVIEVKYFGCKLYFYEIKYCLKYLSQKFILLRNLLLARLLSKLIQGWFLMGPGIKTSDTLALGEN